MLIVCYPSFMIEQTLTSDTSTSSPAAPMPSSRDESDSAAGSPASANHLTSSDERLRTAGSGETPAAERRRNAAAGLADPGETSQVELLSVRFGRQWKKTPAGMRVIREVTDSRAVGLVEAKTPNGPVVGVLVRHIRKALFRLVGEDFDLPLQKKATEDFLTKHRQGHHGGAGRTQGTMSKDGKLYTVRSSVLISVAAVDVLSKAGDGEISLGLRRIATQIRKRLKDRGGVQDLRKISSQVIDSTGQEPSPILVRVYLDTDSSDTLRTLGGGNLSRGIRYAVWMQDRRLR